MPSSGIRLGGAIPYIPSLQIVTTTPLPNAIAGAPYSVQFQATGGVPGYTWTLVGFTVYVAPVSPASLSYTSFTATITTSALLVTPTGGVAPYNPLWSWLSGGAGVTINSPAALSTTLTAAGLAFGQSVNGTLQCVTSDALGRAITSTLPITITRETQLTAVASPSSLSVTGFGGSITTAATAVTPSGGTGPYGYAWAFTVGGAGLTINNPTGQSTTVTASIAAGSTASGTLQCTVNDAYGQTVTTSVSVSVTRETQMIVTASPSWSVSTPQTQYTTPPSTASVSGGTGPYTYAWTWQSGGAGIAINSPASASTTFTASALTAGQSLSGIAQVLVTDALGQQALSTITVSITNSAIFIGTMTAAIGPGAPGSKPTGYVQGGYGALSPTTDANGKTIVTLNDQTNLGGPLVLGMNAGLGAAYFTTMTLTGSDIGTVTRTSASATYTSGTGTWTWNANVAFTPGIQYSVTLA